MADENKTIESLALEADGMGTDTPAELEKGEQK